VSDLLDFRKHHVGGRGVVLEFDGAGVSSPAKLASAHISFGR